MTTRRLGRDHVPWWLLILLGSVSCGINVGGVELGAPPRHVELPADLTLECPGGPDDEVVAAQAGQPELPAAVSEADAVLRLAEEPPGLPVEELRPVRSEDDGTWLQVVRDGRRIMVARTIRYSDGTYGVDMHAYCVGI